MDIVFLTASFFSGIFMFFAPCTLPLVPGFLIFISTETKKKAFLNALFFVIGFSLIFIFLGTVISFLSYKIAILKFILSKIGGVIIIFMGFYILGFFNSYLPKDSKKIFLFKNLKPGNKISSFLLGVSFASGWTPCVGPVLASIFLISGNTQTWLFGSFLLLTFSLGLAIPFLIASIFSSHLLKTNFFKSVYIYKIGGILLVFIGLIMIFDSFYLFTRWGFQVLNFLGYEKIINLL